MSEQYSSDEDACICNGEVGSRSSHKRKEVHNEVERRRKDKINIGILRLGDLLPDKDPRKQSKNGILERASEYITYLKDLNEKLVMDKVTNMEATVFASLRKQIRELEELNANYARLLTTAGIPLTSGPEEIWDHKPKKYSLKHLPDKQRALLACTEVKTVLQRQQQQQPCQHHGTTTISTRPAAEPHAPKAPQAQVAPAIPPAPPPPASSAREATPGCTLVTQALPSAPVMSTAQPSAVTVFQQQHPLTAVTPTATGVTTGAAGGVVSQPILVINDQGVPVLQNVVTFQNTSIILNPQGHAMGARAPGSVVSFTGPDMLPQVHLAAGQSTDDFAHSAAAALGGLMHCDPKLKEAAKLCGVQHNAATFLSGAGMVMNQPLLSLGTGATMIAGQTATAPQVPSAFLLPSGQIIPVVSQPQVVSASMQSAHPLGSQVAANVAAAVSSCSTSLTKVVQCDGTQSYMCREHASSVQNKALTSTPSSSGAAVGTSTVQPGGNCRKQHHSCPQHSSPSTSKCIAVPDSSKTKPVCSHAASKQPLCIRPKPTSQTPDSSQAKSSCARKGGGGKKVAASKSSPELPAKRARTDTPRSDEEAASHTSNCSSTTATTSAHSTEGVSSTSSKDISPLAADILAQATESIFSCGGNVEAAVKQAAKSKNKSPMSASSSDQVTAPAASVPASVETDTGTQASTTSTASSPPSTSVALTQSHCSKVSVLAEAVCSSETVPANSTVEEVPKMKNIFENGRPTEMDAETTSTTSQVSVESGAQPVSAKEGQDDIQASDSDRNELPSLSLHSIVMEENIDISPSVSSTTFTESYVSVSARGNGHSTPQGSSKIPDCAASILCQLTPPSSKSSEDNSKAFVSSTDSLASDQELPLILSIPEDDGHGSLNSNSNPGLSFPSLSPGDQLEHELGNSNAKAVESTSSLSQFVLTPPTPHLTASIAQVSVTSSTSKKKEPLQSSAYTYVAPESFSTPSSHSGELHTIGNTGSSSKQDCHHASRSPQLHSAPPAKLHTEASCHSFVSNAPPTLPMQSRGLQFSTASAVTAPTQVHNISLPGFSTAQGFATPKEPESMPLLDQTSKPPPSPCRMVRDSGRCTTPSKSPSAQFPMSINPYMTTTPFPFPRPDQYTPCTRTPTSQTNTSNSSNTALSCYSAEALIGTQNFLPSSYRLTPPSCAQVPTTQRSSCQQSSRPQISYSAESLIQSQASNPKKDLQTNAKEPSFSNHSGFVNRLPSYQPQTSTQHTTGLSHQRQLPASSSQQVHLGSAAVSVATDNRSQALPVSTAVPPQPTTVHSSYTAQLGNNAQRSLATTPSRYPIHTYHTAKDDFPMLPSAPLHTPPLHTMAPHMSQSPSSRSHHVQPEANPNQNMFQHQNYPYPNFSLGHRSPSFGTCATSRPEVSATSRVPASCLQATSPRQSHFGMQVPTSQQQGCLFPSASSASLLPLTSEFGPQCSGPLAPPPPPVFGNLSQHCAQAPHLVNNLIPGPFATNGNTICGTSLPPPSVESEKPGGRREKQNMHLMSETSCPDTEKQQSKSKSKKSKPSNTSSHSAVSSIPYFPDFRNESHNHALITLPPPPAPSQKLPHAPSLPSVSTSTSSALPWPHHHQQQQHQQLQQAPQPPHSKPSHTGAEVERSANISSAAYNPLFRPQSQQNSINLNLNGSAAPTPHSSSVASFSHHHSPLQRNTQHSSASTSSVASVVSMTGPSISTTTQVAPYSNCAVAPSQHVPNFNLSNIFPDISSGEQARASAAPPPPSTHFYPSSRVLHNSFNHILPPPPPPAPTHNNFVHSGHHAPSFSNVIPPLTFPMHEH